MSGARSPLKIVGKRRRSSESPAENLFRADVLQRQLDVLNPYEKPRGFVFKARTWEIFDAWRNAHPNPRLWRRSVASDA